MHPKIALLLTLAGIVYLFRRDLREQSNTSNALWIPFLWVMVTGSRTLTNWLNVWGFPVGPVTLEEGSPVDRIVFILLIVAGISVLAKRQVRLSELIPLNICLTLFLGYCFLAILWSDYPFISLKRWIKVLGHPIMALVILTEADPEEALVRVMKRASYILVPVSILFIKYFPHLGREFSGWTGAGMNTGITTDKNKLGFICFIMILTWSWQVLRALGLPIGKQRKDELFLCAAFLLMTGWLLQMANSKTSLVAALVGIGMMLFAGAKFINKRAIGTYTIVFAIVAIAAQSTFGVYEWGLKMLGREATLTDRTYLWEDLRKVPINPVLGTGFESFWLGERLRNLWLAHSWRPNQAHNGYLETYLNLGAVGLALLLALIIATFLKSRRELLRNPLFGRYRLGYVAAAVAYNWTEAGFKASHLVFFMFYIVSIDMPRRIGVRGSIESNTCDFVKATEDPKRFPLDALSADV